MIPDIMDFFENKIKRGVFASPLRHCMKPRRRCGK
jgi:hypothetical protein